MDSPKFTNMAPPFRPIVSSRDAVTYGVAKEQANNHQATSRSFPHHIRNTQNCVEHTKAIQLLQGNAFLPMMEGPLHISTSVPYHMHYQKHAKTILTSTQQDLHVHSTQYTLLEFCLQISIFSSRLSIMNMSIVQPWVPHSVCSK